jgi:hypothetical protein
MHSHTMKIIDMTPNTHLNTQTIIAMTPNTHLNTQTIIAMNQNTHHTLITAITNLKIAVVSIKSNAIILIPITME